MTSGKEIGIYVNGEFVVAMAPPPYPVEIEKSTLLDKGQETTMTFEGLFIPDDNPDAVEFEYTGRRKGKVFLKVVNHPYIRFVATDEHAYNATKGMKRGTIITGKINY